MRKPTPNSQGRPPGTGPSGTTLSGSGRVLGTGLTLAISIGLFAFGGLWLDKQFGTKPWLLLLCVTLGGIGGFLHCIRELAPELWPFDKPAKETGNGGRSDSDRPQQNGPPPNG